MSEQTYELRFEYFNEENATLFFQKITDFLLSIDKLNNSLVSVFGIEIDINIQIKSIEKGSIRIWIAEKLNKISDENQRLNSLNHHQKIGYKSQLAQQKEKYENKIKALKYDLDHKNELSFKRKLSQKELLELRKILARDYGMICIKEWEMSLFAEKIGKDTVFEAVLNKLEKELKYWKNYDEFEEKWKKILRK
ncbi:phage regulatory protein [Campylobacter jejuni]|uniref:phage regulatory protein n=1 Tax=Campylobacter sp. CFSAN093233 TaxID=2572078 RepID=UPI0013EEEDDB|nr:phage regulatory protein [Campylobacter sp. CFSAN093233]EDO8561727.1 phage regulatory protein [Campylobacter jejuni]MDV6093736.1 phage regulatory protein [Campylobacter jejuni]NGY56677.1 phage regulatory protein [Campylobacter sp. CFSAN093233]